MFMGVTSHQQAKRVRSYDDAKAVLAKAQLTPTGRQRKEKPEGYHLGMSRNHGVTWVRPDLDGDIAFTLYETDVVIWHPDNSFSVDNFGSVTTQGFASRFTPDGITLRHPVERRGEVGGDKGITYHPVGGDDWRERWKHARICFGGMPRFHPTDEGGWAPDEATIDKLVFPELDRIASRGLAKTFHLRDFETWLGVAPHHIEIEHEGFDVDRCAMALKARDFLTAAAHLPLCKMDTFGRCHDDHALPIRVRGRDGKVTMGSLGKLKLALWEDEGMLKDVIFTSIGLADFNRRMARVRQLDALGFYGTYGPR